MRNLSKYILKTYLKTFLQLNITNHNMPTIKRGTTDLRMPVKQNGEKDRRYKDPQFCNKDGKRDQRCNIMNTNRNK